CILGLGGMVGGLAGIVILIDAHLLADVWRRYPSTGDLLAGRLSVRSGTGVSGRGSTGDGVATRHSSIFRHRGAASIACRSRPADPFCETSFALISLADFGDME